MGDATGSTAKSPKPPRRLKTPPRQVRFEDSNGHNPHIQVTTAAEYAARLNANANSRTSTNPPATTSTQPSSFPALGLPPSAQQQQLPQQPQLGPGQWFSSGEPGQSVSQLPASHLPPVPAAPFNPGLLNSATPVNIPLPHLGPQPQIAYLYHSNQQQPPINVTMAADYQNAAPMPHGANFQPPVPDTSLGPMNHVYIPRSDGGLASQQVHGPPGFHQPPMGGFQPQQAAYVVQPQPAYIPQQQPVMVNCQPAMATPAPQYQAIPAAGGGGGFVGGGAPTFIAGNTGPAPEVAGMGRTVGEEQLRQLNFAHSNKLFEPQEFKPSDDDPSRFYYVRELDGNWTQRNRFSIDHMGDCRWYVTDEGWFYAVRLPN